MEATHFDISRTTVRSFVEIDLTPFLDQAGIAWRSLTFGSRFSLFRRNGVPARSAARVLLLPVGDPQAPIAQGLPVFAGTAWPLRVTVLPSPDALLSGAPGAAAGAMSFTFTATPPADADDLFTALAIELTPVALPTTPAAIADRLAKVASARIKKQLPDSYVNAFPFERPGDGTTRTDEFGCALRDTTPAVKTDPRPPNTITWGAILSFALRQPALARALGLIYDIPFPATIPGPLADGGWVYVELDPAGAIQPASAASVRSYAARLPVLEAGSDRPLFAAVLFPVGSTAAGNYDEALAESASYGDGFAKIVHASQALTADAASSGHNQLRPATDAGIDLGWDDEQVTRWLNRQLAAMRARLGGDPTLVEAPLGVSGYRIDVSTHEEPNPPDWKSLCRAISIDGDGNPAPLQFPPPPAAAVFSTTFNDELTVEPAPARSIHATNQTAWLPQHFTRWQGGSLVANDPTLFELSGTTPRASATDQTGGPSHRGPAADLRGCGAAGAAALRDALPLPLPSRRSDRRRSHCRWRTGHSRASPGGHHALPASRAAQDGPDRVQHRRRRTRRSDARGRHDHDAWTSGGR